VLSRRRAITQHPSPVRPLMTSLGIAAQRRTQSGKPLGEEGVLQVRDLASARSLPCAIGPGLPVAGRAAVTGTARCRVT
jgi:hypothetical protein